MHYYAFHIPDFTLHTSHLTLEEEAVYRRLLDFYYDSEAPIPQETGPVIRRLRLRGYEETVAEILAEFFHAEADGWHNRRADREILAYQERADRARENGKRGGRPKKQGASGAKNPEETHAVISGNPQKSGSKANHKPKDINHKPGDKGAGKPPPFRADCMALPVEIDVEAWGEWCACRSSRRKPISEVAAKKQIKFLAQHTAPVQRQIIEYSIANDYQGLFPPRGEQAQVSPSSQGTTLAEDLSDTEWAR